MQSPDRALPPSLSVSSPRARQAWLTSSQAWILAALTVIPILIFSRWQEPISSLLLCSAGGLLALCARRRRWARQYGGLVAVVAATPVLVDVVLYGRPAMWWLLGGLGVALAAHFNLPPEISIRRVLLTNVRNAVLSAAVGLTSVLAIQLALHYVSEHHEVLARTWTLQIGEVRAWLEEVALLGPKKLAVLLLLLLATAIIAPSLNVVRSYRRIALAASHGLLALIVATSFVFFGNGYSRSAEWVARLSAAREHLRTIDQSHEEVVKAVAVERSLAALNAYQRRSLTALEREIGMHPLRTELKARLATKLISSDARDELTRQVEAARQQLAQGQRSAEHRRSNEVIEAARRQVELGVVPSRGELAALKIERTRAEARRQEGRAAIRQYLVDTVCPPLASELAQSMLDGIPVQGRVPPTDRATATAVMYHASAEPPRVSFDHMLPRGIDEAELLLVVLPALVRNTSYRVKDEIQLAKNAAAVKDPPRWSGAWFRGLFSGGGFFSGGTTRSRGGSRFGVRGGGPLLTA